MQINFISEGLNLRSKKIHNDRYFAIFDPIIKVFRVLYCEWIWWNKPSYNRSNSEKRCSRNYTLHFWWLSQINFVENDGTRDQFWLQMPNSVSILLLRDRHFIEFVLISHLVFFLTANQKHCVVWIIENLHVENLTNCWIFVELFEKDGHFGSDNLKISII